jgi:hypothetical protein
MILFCDKCGRKFVPSNEQMEHIEKSRDKGMKFIMVTCSLCERSVAIDPTSLKSPAMPTKNVGDGLRCPCKACYGRISYVEDEPSFWGCGECGTTWLNIDELFRDIERISNLYIYRKKVYRKNRKTGVFLPVSLEKEPDNYEELIITEWGS